MLQAFISDAPFRYLYLGQFETMSLALAAKAAAQQTLYGPSGCPSAPPAAGGAAATAAGGGGVGAAAAAAAGLSVPAVSQAEVKAMAVKLAAGKQGDLVRQVMKRHGTLHLLGSAAAGAKKK